MLLYKIIISPVVLGSSPNVFTYFSQSNTAGKIIVIALLLLSLLAWTVMVGKYLDLKRLRDLNLNIQNKLNQSNTVLNLDPQFFSHVSGPYGVLSKNAIDAFYRTGHGWKNETARIGHVENALQRSVAEATILYESKMVLLGSIVSGAPFLGLLGTVWGVMDAFGSIALQSSANIQTLAPGVSGALLTTVAALLVAIPSVFGYNYLLTQSKIMITDLENFASSFADRIELEAYTVKEGE